MFSAKVMNLFDIKLVSPGSIYAILCCDSLGQPGEASNTETTQTDYAIINVLPINALHFSIN